MNKSESKSNRSSFREAARDIKNSPRVASLLRRFESFRVGGSSKSALDGKVKPKPNIVMMRHESMRIPASLDHRKGIVLRNRWTSDFNNSGEAGVNPLGDNEKMKVHNDLLLETVQDEAHNNLMPNGIESKPLSRLHRQIRHVNRQRKTFPITQAVQQKDPKIIELKTTRVIQELIDSERIYIANLKRGINDYVLKFDKVMLPNTLSGQRLNIFGNIEVIHELHDQQFLPKLMQCEFDPEEIAETFTTFINESKFDNYIVYVLNRGASEKLCKENEYFFVQIQTDRLGVRSFLLQPIQRLPRYKLLLSEMTKELAADIDNNKNAIAACCIAEKSIQRLLDIMNDHCD